MTSNPLKKINLLYVLKTFAPFQFTNFLIPMEREKLYTALFLASLLRVPQSNSAENFRRDGQSGVNYAHFVKNPFQRLNTAVFDSLIVSRTLECTYRCVNHQECYSVNFATASLKCELLNADKFQNWADVVYSETWDHYNVKVSQ